MESSLRPPRTKPGGRRIWFWLLSLFVISLLLAWGCWLLWPNSQHETPSFNGLTKPVFYRGELLERSALGEKEGLKLPYAFIKEKIDPTIRYEEPSQSVIITTEDKVVRLRTSQLTALVNEKPFQIRFAVEQKGESLYLPVDPLKEYYSFVIHESDKTNLVTVNKGGDSVQWGKRRPPPRGRPGRFVRSLPSSR
ncbi:copper amine oxidase N-terminal domain-containing protein [Paenibacillus sp. CC-CFT747]|nr:copper amine oxidase N-terminal domain-containing protein [Paenibacillus sp. CC-CFT747]